MDGPMELLHPGKNNALGNVSLQEEKHNHDWNGGHRRPGHDQSMERSIFPRKSAKPMDSTYFLGETNTISGHMKSL